MRNIALLFIGIVFSTSSFAQNYSDESSDLIKSDLETDLTDKIAKIQKQADIRQKSLDELSVSLYEKRTNKNERIVISPEDYKKYDINPFYENSEVSISPENLDYLEYKEKNNINMMVSKSDGEYIGYFIKDTDDDIEDAWEVSCSKDKMTDKKRCVLSKFEFVVLYNGSGLRTSVSKELGSLNNRENNYLRIDNKPPFTTKGIYLNTTSKSIVEQLKRGSLLKTRFYEWNGEMYEENIPLSGFTEAYSFMHKAYGLLK